MTSLETECLEASINKLSSWDILEEMFIGDQGSMVIITEEGGEALVIKAKW